MTSPYNIELYLGPDWKLVGKLPFLPVVQESLERLYGWKFDGMRLKVMVADVPHESTVAGTPIVLNLIPEFGFCYIAVTLDGHVVYQHPHPLDDVVTQRLQEILRDSGPGNAVWGFRLDLPGMPPLTRSRPTPSVAGGFTVRPMAQGEKPRFQIRPVEEEEPPARSLKDSDIHPSEQERDARVKVLLPADLSDGLIRERDFSHEVEEGGFLIGRVFRDADHADAFIVEVTEALNAKYTGASLLHFTFTGDSFAEVRRSLHTRSEGERIVGWYHTHLFPATETMGLSSIDFTLHFNTFRIPWQLAGLINLDLERRSRALRFYIRDGNDMKLCPYWAMAGATSTDRGANKVSPSSADLTEMTSGRQPLDSDEVSKP